jgi:hypothetical protein
LNNRRDHIFGRSNHVPTVNDANHADYLVLLLQDSLAEEGSSEVGTTCDWHGGHIIHQEYNRRMKPLPTPHVPGKSEFERFDNAVRQVLTVSKDELLKREQREQDKKEREEKRRPKK